MWNVVICDSDEFFTFSLKKKVEEFYHEREFEVNVRIYPDGNSLLEALKGREKSVDLIFLNTRLSDISGFAVTELMMLTEESGQKILIFMGDHDEDVFRSFFYQPFWYMRKKELNNELEETLQRLWMTDHRDRSLKVHYKGKSKYVRVEDIVYMESDGHYVIFHCMGQDYRFRSRMKEYEEKLQDHYFVRPAKSFLINCAWVDEIGDNVIMKDGSRIPCSKSRKANAQKMWERYVDEIAHCL